MGTLENGRAGSRRFDPLRALFAGLRPVIRRPWLMVALIAVAALAANVAVAMVRGEPKPIYHDEFSYLLAADTYARGRVTNPQHELWRHLEAFHAIVRPSYMSKYPPAQGLFLAAGQVITGKAIVGVWLSAAAMCAAITWMLMGLLPRRWALVGGVLAIVSFGVTTYWSQSFWGGAVAATGGAMLMGAAVRFARKPAWGLSVMMALGLGILANARPFEGLVLSAIFLIPLAVKLLRDKRGGRALLPGVAVFGLIACAMAYSNYRATGSATTLPYAVYQREYATIPVMIFGEIPPKKTFRAWEFNTFYNAWEMGSKFEPRTPEQYCKIHGASLTLVQLFYGEQLFWYGPLVALLLVLPWLAGRHRWIMAAAVYGMLASHAVLSYYQPHYTAVIAGVLIFVVVATLRRIGESRLAGGAGAWLVCAYLALMVTHAVRQYREPSCVDTNPPALANRDEMAAKLAKEHPEGNVVIVSPQPMVVWDWVANSADIDSQKVVWVRDLGWDKNEAVFEYYPKRSIWQLHFPSLELELLREPE